MKRLTALICVCALLLTLALPVQPAYAAELVASGTCGTDDAITWTLDSDGLLTFSGTGEMSHPGAYGGGSPWLMTEQPIYHVVIGEGITSIEYFAFYGCDRLQSVSIPESVTTINSCAFSGCSSLAQIRLPDGLTSMGWGVFSGCSSLTKIVIPALISQIGEFAFGGCSSLRTIIFRGDAPTFINLVAFEGVHASVHYPAGNDTWNEEAFAKFDECEEICEDCRLDLISHVYTQTVVEPSHTQPGYTVYYCPDCEDSYTDDYTDPIPLAGDVNRDGTVDGKDRTALSRYLAKWGGYTDDSLDLSLADLDGNGKINSKDRAILARHLADWEGYETLSLPQIPSE